MGEMVLDLLDPAAEDAGSGAGQLFLDSADPPRVPEAVPDEPDLRPVAEPPGELAPEVRARVAVDGHDVHVAEVEAGLAEAPGDRFGGKAGPVLQPSEALLFDRRDEAAVHHEGRGRVGVVGVQTEHDHARSSCPFMGVWSGPRGA